MTSTINADNQEIKNALVALQVIAISKADQHLQDLAEKGIEALERLTQKAEAKK